MLFKPWILTSLCLIAAATARASEPFETCLEQAFLFQSAPFVNHGNTTQTDSHLATG